jgi:hypothetical protein
MYTAYVVRRSYNSSQFCLTFHIQPEIDGVPCPEKDRKNGYPKPKAGDSASCRFHEFVCFLHDKVIHAGSMAFIFMCITTKNEMKSCKKENVSFEKVGFIKISQKGTYRRSLVSFHCVKV